MKSIQTKITLLILTVIVVCSCVIGSAGIISSKLVIEKDSAKIMSLMCSDKAKELNNTLSRIEQSVEILSVHSINNIESTDKLSDSDYIEDYIKNIDELSYTVACETKGAVAVYLRFNPDLTTPDAGFFRVWNPETNDFESNEITDLSAYSPGDFEHVGWYYTPVRNGKATWLGPYYNSNINIYMISYVIPIYKGNVLIGIVGMDIDFGYVKQLVDSISAYDTGYAFLADNDFRIAYHKNIVKGQSIRELSSALKDMKTEELSESGNVYYYKFNGIEKKIVFRALENDMLLAVTAPVSEIDDMEIRLVNRIILFTILIALIFILVSSYIAKTLIRPLKELNNAALEIAKGNLEVSLVTKTKDEIGTLTDSLRDTAHELKKRISYINELAFTDSLTGIGNNAAYLRDVQVLKEAIANGTAAFSMAIIDVNNLKYINDNYGHDKGNILIITAVNVAQAIFGSDVVYRIGGDEFAILLNGAEEGTAKLLAERYVLMLSETDGDITVSAAIGTATYNSAVDDSFDKVFKRADEEMYRRKAEMKKNGECSKVVQ